MKPLKDVIISKDLIYEFGTNSHSIPEYILLYDNFEGVNPVSGTHNLSIKIEQMVLMLITQGDITLNINGDTNTFQQRSCICITPDSIVEYKSSSSNLQYILYVMYPQLIKETLQDLGMNTNLLLMSHTMQYSLCDEEFFKYRMSIYKELKEELSLPNNKHKKLFARGYTNIILINNINLFNIEVETVPQGNKISRQRNVYTNFIDLLNRYSDTHREVQFYASKLDITPKYLSAVAIEYSGKNASCWIDEYVTTKAKTMLREQQYNIKTVSERLNFPSQSFFGRYFKRVTGMSPKQFIQSYKKK